MEEPIQNIPVTPKPNPFTTVTPLSKALALILFIALPFLGYYLGMKYQAVLPNNQQLANGAVPTTPNPQPNIANVCTKKSYGDINEILTKYSVRRGDSLLSIAKKELGDSSRLQELAVMNSDKYPTLFSSPGVLAQNPFLEQGWVLSLPPKWITSSSGQLQEVNGLIFTIRPDGHAFEISSNSGQSGHFATINLDSNTINSNKVSFKEGNCITAIVDVQLNKVLRIDLQ